MTSRMISGRPSRRREIYPEEGGVMFHKASLQGVPSEHLPAAHALRRPLPPLIFALDLRLSGGEFRADDCQCDETKRREQISPEPR